MHPVYLKDVPPQGRRLSDVDDVEQATISVEHTSRCEREARAFQWVGETASREPADPNRGDVVKRDSAHVGGARRRIAVAVNVHPERYQPLGKEDAVTLEAARAAEVGVNERDAYWAPNATGA